MTPFSFQRGSLTLRGIVAGEGDPLVMLHGGGSRASTFTATVPRLATTRRVIAFDQRGFGDTGAGPDHAITHQNWAEDVIACLDHFGIARTDLCGWSMGAAVALNVASQWPDRISSLVLLGAPRPDRPIDRKIFEKRLALIASGASAAEVVDATFGATLGRGFSPLTLAQRPEAIAAVRREQLDQNVALAARVVDAYCSRPDLMAIVARVMCPVHLIVGADDKMCDLEGARVLQRHLKSATLAIIPDCGHYYAVERPEAVAEAILSALAG
ncbi:MAG: alpha/beta hydrolase [Alphaproteobacteria bacterium]|nr:alpha/beta hydrolase [Alphaproteobacteria bacterium]